MLMQIPLSRKQTGEQPFKLDVRVLLIAPMGKSAGLRQRHHWGLF